MIDSLYIGASGLVTHQKDVDTVANNLANLNTVAFKKARVAFHDLYQNEMQGAAASTQGADSLSASVPRSPSGVSVGNVERIFSDGELTQTGGALDVAIRGTGFFEVELPDGSSAFTRNGTFQMNTDRQLVTPEGYLLKQQIQIPDATTAITINPSGLVQAQVDGETGVQDVGQIELSQFVNPASLNALGGGYYTTTESAGDAQSGNPGENGLGLLAQGFQESSNVQLVDELVSLMIAQRGYEASSKVVQVSDDILGMVNNLRR
ncbi:MAG TPA: flagellar basal-body rod protein FlgG [Rhodocyclaceae bacterium]|nr:flagellar basal-body rod protein FlgG [Rhodocyclaceae bacterium]